jgi:DNA-3-methyladenine glycosylase
MKSNSQTSSKMCSELEPLPRSFYLRPTLEVAPKLLGKLFVRLTSNAMLVGRIVEVEAYCMDDPASHTFRGRTKRNDVMFWQGGHLYVYFTYGMHYCANVVTEREGIGEAVLIRAVEPIAGIETMIKNRFPSRAISLQIIRQLTNGPAKFCEAFGLTKQQNGVDLVSSDSGIFITECPSRQRFSIAKSERIGIRNGKEKLWRFFIKDSEWLSR